MDKNTLLTILKNALIALVTAFAVLLYLQFTRGTWIPGLEPFVVAAYFGVQWGYNVLRQRHPGGIWTLLYVVFIASQIIVGIQQLINA